jgi:hypothetical protein
MHYLPPTVFGSKDHRNPQSDWDDIFPSANLGLGPLHSHEVGKLRSYVFRYGLEASDLAISEIRGVTLQPLSDLLPSTPDWEVGVSEGYVFSMGEDLLTGSAFPVMNSSSARSYGSITSSRSSTAVT